MIISRTILWKLFKKAYVLAHNKKFVETPDTLANIAPVIEYFSMHENFFRRKALITKTGNTKLVPGFNKGLLIVGGYGNGKTTIMEALGLVFDHYRMPMRFKGYKAHNLVTEYERIGADKTYLESSKYQFCHRLTHCKGLYIDDVKKEREASNYGKVNLIRDILEKRYDHKQGKTYITCNYREGDTTNDLEDALAEFGELYGGHIYDRLFSMFNILEFKGPTFRR
ncbi:hypothetical protein NBT05_02560 [Aquimarina sp. ERC-38]|uniref:hypothetical protein n=1 Tax=Aquimarina sp. ERC-38 TaxID=2949996 RepID=UPI002245469E|nr:hypothetical protein [Aquimarina sp. ERC-38]UZO81364.1 hypothetical protein NBT05_02560 [Aquimarina sp. ERC-38]